MIAELEGTRFGPATVAVARERVADLVAATDADPARWSEHAPPSFANVGLFAVAPDLLDHPAVGDHRRAIVHAEQRYTWSGPIPVGEVLTVEGTVERVRLRGATAFVDLAATMRVADTEIASFSRFLMGAGPLSGGVVPEPEPDAETRATSERPRPWSGVGEIQIPRSASRADLVRYAAATRDLNPIHWDHDRALAAGFPGVICHGLLQVAWLLEVGAAARPGPHPVAELRVRFKAPLRPAIPALVTASGDGTRVDAAVADAGGIETVSGSLVLGQPEGVTA